MVGIGSQDKWTEGTKKIIDTLLEFDDVAKIVVMLHPNESRQQYSEYLRDSRVIVGRSNYYINLDVFITHFSTLIYDYLYSGFSGRIVSIPPTEKVFGFMKNESVIKLKEYSEIKKVVSDLCR